MESIDRLFDDFAIAYGHSLYAIEQEERRLAREHDESRNSTKKRFDKDRSKVATAITNSLMANMHKLNEAFQELTRTDDSVVRAAEFLAFGNVTPRNIDRLIYSDCSLPWIMPFLGHKNIFVESNDEACQSLGLQFALQALLQTAPGQLSITVINPELRPEFSPCTRLPFFKMLTRQNEIADEFSVLTEEIIRNDTVLQGRFSSLLELRKQAQQPVGQLRLVVVQDLPKGLGSDFYESFLRVAKGAPRAGIAIIFLSSKSRHNTDNITHDIKKVKNFFVFAQSGKDWQTQEPSLENITFSFPSSQPDEIANEISNILEAAKNTSVITIPFDQIEDIDKMWTASAVSNLVFNLGKCGLDTVSVCIGDSVSQLHNILISGAAGKGKSNLIEVMIHSLCVRYSPDELELYLLDFKDGLTFKPYSSYADSSWLPHARMLGLESDRDIGLAVLKDLEAERRRRAALFSSAEGGAHDYESYRKRHPEAKIPRIVLVVDEYQKLFDISDEISEEASLLLENLVRQGRACSIHIILASQSITGAAGLLGKEERIYAQFPVRIALQNTLSESYSLFGLGNDAAAQLRVRGEAVINVNYGAQDSNVRFTVAYAEPERMKAIRQLLCATWKNNCTPVIFGKHDVMDFSMLISDVKRWRAAVLNGRAVSLPFGIKLSVRKDVLSIPFPGEIGKNVVLLGSAEDLQREGAIPGKMNCAIGILQGFGLSLALQHPNGDARFVLIDGLTPEVEKNSNMSRWFRLMERFGFPVELVSANEASAWLIDFQQDISANDYGEATYIIGLGMDRCGGLMDADLSGASGASAFQEILKYGSRGVHFMGWWSSVSMFQTHIGFGNDGYIGTKILLRMDTDTARDVLGPFVNWSVRDNRAYIHDASDLASDEVVIPFEPISDRVSGIVEAEAW